MTFSTLAEIEEQEAAQIVHICWTGKASYNFAKTLKTLRKHWLARNWSREQAALLVQNNIRDAYREQGFIGTKPKVFERAEDALMHSIERLFLSEGES